MLLRKNHLCAVALVGLLAAGSGAEAEDKSREACLDVALPAEAASEFSLSGVDWDTLDPDSAVEACEAAYTLLPDDSAVQMAYGRGTAQAGRCRGSCPVVPSSRRAGRPAAACRRITARQPPGTERPPSRAMPERRLASVSSTKPAVAYHRMMAKPPPGSGAPPSRAMPSHSSALAFTTCKEKV
jgi:hypothetical protein